MRYKSCHLLEHGISIEDDSIRVCCILREAYKGKPFIKEFGNEDIDWAEIFRIKRIHRLKQKNGGFSECEGCSLLREEDWDDEDFISYINFDHWRYCNSNCIYCGVHDNKNKTRKKVIDSIENLIKIGKFRNYGKITFQGGEPTLLPEFESLLYMFVDNSYIIRVHSSGILYSSAIKECLKKKSVIIVISPDAGSAKTYKTIKRVNKFDKVWSNIRKYRDGLNDEQVHYLKVKYIIVPGINDNLKEVNLFFDKINKYGIKNLIIDIEADYANLNNYNISSHIYMLIDYMVYLSNLNGIQFELYDTAQNSNNYRNVSNTVFDDMVLFKKEFEKIKKQDKTKKMPYVKSLRGKLFQIFSNNGLKG